MKILVPEDVLVQDLGTETVLLNLKTEQYFGLDDVGSSMWAALSDTGVVETAYQRLLSEYEVEPSLLNRDLQHLVGELVEHGLLQVVAEKA